MKWHDNLMKKQIKFQKIKFFQFFLIGQSENRLRYSDGRESASSLVARTLTAVGVFYSIALGTLSAVGVLYPAATRTLAAVTIFAHIAEVLYRLLEYFRSCSKHFVGCCSIPSRSIGYSIGRCSTPSRGIAYFVGRCSTPSRSIENSVGRHNTCANRGGTLSAVKILAHNEEVFLLDVKVYKHRFNEKKCRLDIYL